VPLPHDEPTVTVSIATATDTLTILRSGIGEQAPAEADGTPGLALAVATDPADAPAVDAAPLPAPDPREPWAGRGWVRNGWRLLVVSTGAILLVTCSATAIGIVQVPGPSPDRSTTDASPAPVADLPAPSVEAITGADGVYPGGAARPLPVMVRNPAATPLEILSVRPDLSGVPGSCPAAAWRIGAASGVPAVPAAGRATVTLTAALVAGAPNSCQGVTVTVPVTIEGRLGPDLGTAPSGSTTGSVAGSAAGSTAGSAATATLAATATVRAATLGSPTAALTVHGSQIAVQVTRPGAGPTPASYQVTTIAPDGRRGVLCERSTGSCLDTGLRAASGHGYLVTARLGEHWSRSSTALHGWTPAPAPRLAFADSDRPAGSALTLEAPAGAGSYEVALYADGSGSPFHTERVPAGSGIDRIVPPPGLRPGRHRIVAVALFKGARTSSGTLRLTVPGTAGSDPVTPAPAGPDLPTSPPIPEPQAPSAPAPVPVAAAPQPVSPL
jgi:hypothetical protein